MQSRARLLVLLGGSILALVHAACSAPEGDGGADGGLGGEGTGTGGIVLGTGGETDILVPEPNENAFPAEPIFDPGIDAAEAAVFANVDEFAPGVCVFEPHLSDANGPGALFPMNWLRPRFRWTGTGAETLWEIRLTAESQTNDLVVYTRESTWILPQELWATVAQGVQDPITVTVRGSGPSGLVGFRGDFRITPALAGGSMVFWGTSSSVVEPGSSRLFGFTMGDEAVVETLRAEQITGITNVLQANGRDVRGENQSSYIAGIETGAPRCIGCHSATPDGTAMAFTDDYPWNMALGSIEDGTTGAPPDYLSAGARELMKIPFLGTSTMVPAAWETGDRTLLATMGSRVDYVYVNYASKPEPTTHDLIWLDLSTTATIPSAIPAAEGTPTIPWADDFYSGYQREQASLARETAILAAEGTAWGVLASEAGGSISNPVASRTGLRLAYTVSESSIDGHPDWHNDTADIKLLELVSAREAAGAATLLEGASSPTALEYYPSFSPDDAFVAFTTAPAPSNTTRCRQGVDDCDNDPSTLGENPDGPYYNRKGEIAVVSSAGGEPHRLRGNDPVACGGQVSPGVLNSWPKWSSAVREYEGKNYYFIIFSSARAYPDQFELAPTSYTPPIENKSSHLYMSVLEHDPATGTLVSYAAIYLWNQNYLATGPDTYEALETANLTPAWEDFSIPTVPPVIVVR